MGIFMAWIGHSLIIAAAIGTPSRYITEGFSDIYFVVIGMQLVMKVSLK